MKDKSEQLAKRSEKFHLYKLQETLDLRQKKNKSYSLRAYARDLSLNVSTLSQVLSGKRELTYKSATKVIQDLALNPRDKTRFMDSLNEGRSRIDLIKIQEDQRYIMDESYVKVIGEWEHFAIETLLEIDGFDTRILNLSKKLNVSESRINEVLENLKTCGLIREDKSGKIKKVYSKIRTTEDVPSEAIRKGHREVLDMGKQKLEEVALELRDFSSITVATDLDKIPEVKAIIREFRQKMMALLKDGHKTDVFQLAIQFYPLTNTEDKHV